MDLQFGDFFRKKRIQAGLSQWEIAIALGYSSPQLVSNWERGMCNPPKRKLKKLIGLLGITKREFLDFYVKEQIRLLNALL